MIRRAPWWLLIVLLGAAAYLNSFAGVFLFDDKRAILTNLRVHSVWPLTKWLGGSMRPVAELTFAVNYALGGARVWGYHLVNLVIHLLAALTLYGLVRRTLAAPRFIQRLGPAAPWLALAVALVWVVHPLQTGSVTYLVQRAEALTGLWFLLTLYAVARLGALGSGLGASQSSRRRWSFLAVTACALGMATKSVMVTAPLVALLYDRACLAGSWSGLRHPFDSAQGAVPSEVEGRQRRGVHVGLAATWLILPALAATVPPEARQSYGFGMTDVTPLRYVLTQPAVILHYLRLAIWPHPLVLDYAWPLVDTVGQALPALAVIGGLILASLRAWRSSPAAGFLAITFFLILAPSSSVFPLVDIAFEHRMYLPLACVVTLLTLGAWRLGHWLLPSATTRAAVAAPALIAVVAILSALTVRRNADYRSEAAMWQDVLAKRPMNPRAHAYVGDLLVRAGQVEEGVASYRRAVQLKPDYAEAYNNLGLGWERLGRLDEAAAAYVEAIRLRPIYPQMHVNLARILDQQGKTIEAMAAYKAALRLSADYAEAHAGLGALLAEQGNLEAAATHLETAIRLNPADAPSRHNLGVVLMRQGRVAEAAAHLEAAKPPRR